MSSCEDLAELKAKTQSFALDVEALDEDSTDLIYRLAGFEPYDPSGPGVPDPPPILPRPDSGSPIWSPRTWGATWLGRVERAYESGQDIRRVLSRIDLPPDVQAPLEPAAKAVEWLEQATRRMERGATPMAVATAFRTATSAVTRAGHALKGLPAREACQ